MRGCHNGKSNYETGKYATIRLWLPVRTARADVALLYFL